MCFLVCCCSWVVQAEETPSSAIKYHGVGDVIITSHFLPPCLFSVIFLFSARGLKSRRPPLIRIYVYEKELFDCLSTAIGSMYRRLRGLDERLPCIVVAYTSQRSLEARSRFYSPSSESIRERRLLRVDERLLCVNLPEGKGRKKGNATIIMIAAAAATTTTKMSGAEGVCAGARASLRQLAQKLYIFFFF